ncbi:MAG TPA: TetR/AcrR family transcriptional regulator [Devosiaceae bacterium]|jgi:AcrR family transcriptional regulator
MGHKEDLLAGAKKCLLERGYAHTTARDIVAASGTNLASIGYHFGSKDTLMAEAMMQLMGEWGDQFSPPELRNVEMPSLERFRGTWARLTEQFVTDRQLLVASFEIFSQLDRIPQLRTMMAAAYEQLRQDFAFDFLSLAQDVDMRTLRSVSSLMLALLTGLSTQYLVDPEHAPTVDDLVHAFRVVGKALAEA